MIYNNLAESESKGRIFSKLVVILLFRTVKNISFDDLNSKIIDRMDLLVPYIIHIEFSFYNLNKSIK